MYGGLIQLPYILASVVGWVLPKPRLVGCGYAATQVGSLSIRGLGFKASLNPQFWHHTQSSSLPVVLSTRFVSNTCMKAEEEEPRSSART